MIPGFYEKIITLALQNQLKELQHDVQKRHVLGKNDGAIFLGRFFQQVFQKALLQLSERSDELAKPSMIALANDLVKLVAEKLDDPDFLEELIAPEGELLRGYFQQAYFGHSKIDDYFSAVFPFTGLSESELFTGSKTGLSLESELKKEMLTADQVWWLVSFIKFEGVRLFDQVLQKLQDEGKEVRIICTVYMGATDVKAIDFLSRFTNVQLKISYNTQHERLHAKSYLFIRNSGFHTGYIGSSNMSRSALTNGLEWNVKVTQQEIPHIISKCRSTFETYWNDSNFELYDEKIHREKLLNALNAGNKKADDFHAIGFFDLKPFPYQQEILDQLELNRRRGNFKNLIVAATGTGKTVMAAFDFKRYLKENPQARFLFVAHREEILRQSMYTFRQVLRNNEFGDIWIGGHEPSSYQHLFVSIQTLNNRIATLRLAEDYYDYIVIDEVHHSAASSYQKVLQGFRPKLLLGLTATPERHDGDDISQYFGHQISAEIRLPEALNRGLLCPFQYFGITDTVDLSGVSWRRGRYDIESLERIYSEDHRRVSDILRNCEKYLKDIHEVRALGFCVSKKHASFMALQFQSKGLKAAVLTSDNSSERNSILQQFKSKEFNYLFVVDIFNEGVDIPEVDTLLFLRPTESLTVFLQQLGRGLRLHEDKSCLTVLDFVGQQHVEYSFEHKFRGMLGKTHTRVKDEIENDFPHLPIGCAITLERTAKEIILNNIKKAYRGGLQSILKSITRFKTDYTLTPSLENFCSVTEIGLHKIYGTQLLWFHLLDQSKGKNNTITDVEVKLAKAMGTTWLSCESLSYFEFIAELFRNQSCNIAEAANQQFLLMLYIDVFGQPPNVNSYGELFDLFMPLLQNHLIRAEVIAYMNLRMRQCISVEQYFEGKIPTVLNLHGRYSRNQILVAFSETTLNTLASSREGVYRISKENVELLFVTLDKSEGHFNPNTMYHDYFISEELFHWQSQNSTSERSSVGQSYIQQAITKKEVLLFVREATRDENGLTMAFIFCGPLHYLKHEGSKPMSITWRLQFPPPAELLNEGRKLAVG